MHCDHYHRMSNRHKICQDYTLVSNFTDGMCAILSDGCSSADDTDVGARVIAHQFKQKLPKHWGSDYGLANSAGLSADTVAMNMGLSPESNYATVGYIYSNKQIVKTALFGDGLVYILDKNDQESIFYVHFNDNTPYYPYYVHDKDINESYFNGKHGRYTVYSVSEDGHELVSDEFITPTMPTTFMGIYPASQIKLLAMFSDGIDSFVDKAGEVPIYQVVEKFTAFKNFTGEFVHRRCTAVFREWEHLTWKDDFSMIALTNDSN